RWRWGCHRGDAVGGRRRGAGANRVGGDDGEGVGGAVGESGDGRGRSSDRSAAAGRTGGHGVGGDGAAAIRRRRGPRDRGRSVTCVSRNGGGDAWHRGRGHGGEPGGPGGSRAGANRVGGDDREGSGVAVGAIGGGGGR